MRCGLKDGKEEKKKKGMERVCAEGREEEEGDMEKKMKKKKKEKRKKNIKWREWRKGCTALSERIP